MIDFKRVFHTGFLVEDLKTAMDELGASLGLRWAEPARLRGHPFWIPEKGLERLDLDVTYSIDGPHHIEIQCGTPGSVYDIRRHTGFHNGLWVQDLPDEIEKLISRGWKMEWAGARPEEGYGTFAYLSPPSSGIMLELVSTNFKPMFETWISGKGTLS